MMQITPTIDQSDISLSGELVNDIHSRLNPTMLKQRAAVGSHSAVVDLIEEAKSNGDYICIAGGRHAMGGQQFLTDGLLIDMTAMNKILAFDDQRGLLIVEAGIRWTELIAGLQQKQIGRESQWTIVQKQTGCDQLSIGGSLSANGHGRGLLLPPIVADVEEFDLVLYDGQTVKCSRRNNPELFSLAVGGYGMFGIITAATLRLAKRTRLSRTVEVTKADEVIDKLESHARSGAMYGDFQFAIDHNSPDFLNKGILSVYTATESTEEPLADNKLLSAKDWRRLLYLAHTNKTAAFKEYTNHYLSTNGQLYWSDTFQLSTYFENYHKHLDEQMPGEVQGTEMITELYVPRRQLGNFMKDAAKLLRERKANVIYGTVRVIEKDNDTFLPWATESYACIVLNLHVQHTEHEIMLAGKIFRELISLAIWLGGSYFLTYHRFAGRDQLLTCYPQLPQFIERKFHYDPQGLFRSDWSEHCFTLAGDRFDVRLC